MKLYYKSGACSLSPHIVLRELGLNFEVEAVDLKTKITASGKNFYDINPKGQVPTLVLDDGTILTEGVAIVQYLADRVPEKSLFAPVNDIKRYQIISWLNFVATELHKGFAPHFYPVNAEATAAAIEKLKTKFEYVNDVLSHSDFITGPTFTIADSYLYTILRYKQAIPDLPAYPAIDRYMERVKARPAVAKALEIEGLK